MELTLSQNISKLRKEHHLTQEQLAEALGVTFASVSKWERGAAAPELTLIAKMADFFGVSLDALVGFALQNGSIQEAEEELHTLQKEKKYREGLEKAEKAISRENETYTATLKDCLGGFSVIKSFQAEAQMLRLFQGDLQRLAEAQCRRQKMQILISALGSVAGVVAQLGVFLVGAYLALSGKGVTAGTTMVFVQLMNYVLSPIQTIPTCLAERKAAKALVRKAADLLGANVRENPDTDGEPLRDSICLKDLSFAYEPEKPVLKNINCTFSLGKRWTAPSGFPGFPP